MVHAGRRMPITVSTGCGRVSLYRLHGRWVVILTGEIDVAFRAEPFGDIVAAVGEVGGPVHVDCSAVTFFGAEGLRMLEALAGAAADHRLVSIVASRSVGFVAELLPGELPAQWVTPVSRLTTPLDVPTPADVC